VPVRQLSEIELARRMLAGSHEAFDSFVETFRSKVFQYSFWMCGQREDAEEVAQDTLLKVFQSIEQLREPERVRPWVFQIAKNVCLMKRRKSIFAPAEEVSLDEPRPGQDGGSRRLEIADSSELPDAALQRHEMQYHLAAAIGGVPQMYRSVLLLRDVEELSTEETAQVLDLSIDVVKTRLRRARVMLRRQMETILGAGIEGKERETPGPLPGHVREELITAFQKALRKGRGSAGEITQ